MPYICTVYISLSVDWNSSVSEVTGYGTDNWGSIPGRDRMSFFTTTSRMAMGPTQTPIHENQELKPSGKAART